MERWNEASFTVEAAMIIGIVLLVIVAVLKGSRSVYERSMETASEYESNLLEKEENPSPVTYARRAQFAANGTNRE